MARGLLVSVVLLISAVVVAAPAAPAPASHGEASDAGTTHLASTWDAADHQARVQDPTAIAAVVHRETVLTSTAHPACDLYTTTFTLTWTATGSHRLTAVVTQDDGFGYGWRALDQTSWSMTPAGIVYDEQSPVVRTWYVRGTHHRDPAVCPRNSRTVNHVEIYVDGPPRHAVTHSIVKAPPRSRLAVVWTWPDQLDIVAPPRVDVSRSVYTEIESPVGACEAHLTEVDLNVTAVGGARLTAIGLRSPGGFVNYQNGDSESFGLGIVSHAWFLTGTTTKSELCPADTLSEDRVEVYATQG